MTVNRWVAGLSLKRKLTVAGVATAASALLVTTAAILITTFVSGRSQAIRDIRTQALIVAESTSAAVAFGDVDAARETLEPLKARQSIEYVCVVNDDGTVLAAYSRSGAQRCAAAARAVDEVTLRSMRVVAPVVFGDRRFGVVVVGGTFSDLFQQMRFASIVALLALCAGASVAMVVARMLNRLIAGPVLRLAAVARDVGARGDYTLRAPAEGDDELGFLVGRFNQMLNVIEQRDQALEREITERRRAEEERATLLEREQNANRLKDEFLAALSHELRTPLNAVLGWIQVLLAVPQPPDEQRHMLSRINLNARLQARIIDDLLDVSKIVSGKFLLHPEVVDLRVVVDNALDVVRPAAVAKSVTLNRHVHAGETPVWGDPHRLQQVIWNLLSNAVKFTPPGGRIDIGLAEADGGFEVTVHDTGIGIGRNFLPHVFDRFRQADGSITREHSGLGLGLAIVKEIVTLHGGSVEAGSPGEDQGATFTIRLRRFNGAVRPSQSPAPIERVQLKPLEGITVLLVDDDQDARSVASLILAEAGADVRTADSGAAALAAAEGAPYAVLVSDIGMAGMDGYTLLRTLRSREALRGLTTPAVALTAYAADADTRAAYAAGYQAHIAKPFDPVSLIHAVLSAVNSPPVQ